MNRVILSSITALLLIAALAIGYFYYEGYTENKSTPESALPPDAAFFIQGNTNGLVRDLGALSFWKNADSSTFIFELRRELNLLSEFFSAVEFNNSLSKESNALFSFQFTGIDKVDALFIFPVKKDLNIAALTNFIKGKSSGASENPVREFSGVNIYELNFKGSNKQFTYAFSSGLFIGSFTSFLVEDAIRQQNSGKIFGGNKTFLTQYRAWQGKGDYILCTHFPKLKNFISAFLSQENLFTLNSIGKYADWSIQHVIITKEKIVADGFIVNRDTNTTSSALLQCNPTQSTLTEILPASVNIFQSFVFDDFNKWVNTNQKHADEDEQVRISQKNISHVEKKHNTSIVKKLSNLVSTELTAAIAANSSSNYQNNLIAFIKLTDGAKAEAALKSFALLSENQNKKPIQFESFKKHKIGLLPFDGLMPSIFGSPLSSFRKGYYTIHKNYLLVAVKVSVLRNCIEEIDSEKFLYKTKNFEKISGYLKDKCNFLIYSDAMQSINLWSQLTNEKNVALLSGKQDYFKSFSSFLFMAGNTSQNKINCRTVFSFGQNITSKETSTDWSYVADTMIYCGPFLAVNKKNRTAFTLFQDTAQNLFCINQTGSVLWQQKVDGLIHGKIQTVHFIDTGMVQFLFATDKKIYLINEDGSALGNYPIKLPAPSAAGVFKAENSFIYFLPCDNQRIYVYDISGRPAKGWDLINLNGNVSAINFYSHNTKDYVYFTDEALVLYLYQNTGKLIYKSFMRQPAAGNQLSVIADSTINITVSDSTGTIYTYRPNNTVSIRSTDYTGKVTGYIHADVNGDNLSEHLFIHPNNITALKNDFTLLYKYPSTATLNGSAEIIETENKKYLMVYTEENRMIILDEKGKMLKGFPLVGSNAAIICEGKKFHIVLKENSNTIKAYKTEN